MNKNLQIPFFIFCALLLSFTPNRVFGNTASDVQKEIDGWKAYVVSVPVQSNKLLERPDTFLRRMQKWVAIGVTGINRTNWDRYNELYFNARTHENLARQELVMAHVFFDKKMFKEAREHLEQVSWQSRKWNLYDQAANEAWLGNLEKAQQIEYEAGKTVNNAVGFIGKTINKVAEKTGNPTIIAASNGLEYEAAVLNFTLDLGFKNLPAATKSVIKDKAIDIFANAAAEEFIGVGGGVGSMAASDFRLATGITRLQNIIQTPVNASRETLAFIKKELANNPRLFKATVVKVQEQLNKIPTTAIKVSEDNSPSLSNSALPSQPLPSIPPQTLNNKEMVPAPSPQPPPSPMPNIPSQSLDIGPLPPNGPPLAPQLMPTQSTSAPQPPASTSGPTNSVQETPSLLPSTSQETQPIVHPAIVPAVNPQLFLTPTSGQKGTLFTFTGSGFTPNGSIKEVIIKPDGTQYPPLYYTAGSDGRHVKTYDSSTASIFGSYTIYWIDQVTGRQSNSVNETIIITASVLPPASQIAPAPLPPPQTPAPQPSVSVPVVNPMLYLLPTSGPKGTKFTFAGIRFTPNGVIREIITKPDGTQYAPNYYTANADGNRDKFYDSSTASIFGTYAIYWVDESTGKRSNTVYEMISAY